MRGCVSCVAQTQISLIHSSGSIDRAFVNLGMKVYMVIFEYFGILLLSSIVKLIGLSEAVPPVQVRQNLKVAPQKNVLKKTGLRYYNYEYDFLLIKH